jgi:hypothetical protein
MGKKKNSNRISVTINSGLIEESNIVDSNIEGGNIIGANIVDLSLVSANIDSSNFVNGNVLNSEITNSVLKDVEISGNVIASNVDLQNSTITKTKIENSHILDSLLSNVSIIGVVSNVDYTQSPLNGYYSTAFCNQPIPVNLAVEIQYVSGKIIVQPTDPSSRNPFFGIAQSSSVDGVVNVLTQGVSAVAVRNVINLPVLIRSPTGTWIAARDQTGKIITRPLVVPILKNDLLVIAGTNSDILVGPLTQYYQFNAIGNNGLLTVYKTIQVNQANGSYVIVSVDQNTVLAQKLINGGKFIQVLDVDSSGNNVIGYLSY